MIESITCVFPALPRRSIVEEEEYRALFGEFNSYNMYEFLVLTNSEDGWLKVFEGSLDACVSKRHEYAGRYPVTRIKTKPRKAEEMTEAERERHARYEELAAMWPCDHSKSA